MSAIARIFVLSVLFLPVFISGQGQIINISPDIQLIHLNDSVYIHTSWIQLPEFGRFPSNGMIVIKNGKAVMVDTPNNNEQTEQLAIFLSDSMNIKIETVIVCHYHIDNLGGLEYLHSQGVNSVSLDLTKLKCTELNLPLPKLVFENSLDINFYGREIQCRFFGGGHTYDNIVVNLPQEKILFGGCLIKSINSTNLGNLADAVVDEWDSTVETLMNEIPGAETVIPGHGNYGGRELLDNTLNLVKEYKQK